jgi:hypothetical protein
VDYSAVDTSRFVNMCNADGTVVGFVDFTNELKYLDPVVSSFLTSDIGVDKLSRAATQKRPHRALR